MKNEILETEGMVLMPLSNDNLEQFKKDMQKSFRMAAFNTLGFDDEVLPLKDINLSLSLPESEAFMVISQGELIGGAIVEINKLTKFNCLDFLYVNTDFQGKGVGHFIWNEIENLYPDTEIWETCTPYFDKRNIHFYINCLGFHAVEFFNKFNPDPFSAEDDDDTFDGMFRFQKNMKSTVHYGTLPER